MYCPNCGHQLQKVPVSTSQGGRFEVDHCSFCGGTWFDPYEINRIPFHEVISLANLTALPKKQIRKLKKPRCPLDNHTLEPFSGDAVPRNVKLLWCKKCLGIWASQKDLWEFKKHQDETVSAYDTAEKFFPTLSSVVIPFVTFLFLLVTTFTTIVSLQQVKEERIYAESQITMLQTEKLTPSSVVITFNTQTPATSVLYYGPSSLELTGVSIVKPSSINHSFILEDLKPETDYVYKIKLTDTQGRTYTSDLKIFTTK